MGGWEQDYCSAQPRDAGGSRERRDAGTEFFLHTPFEFVRNRGRDLRTERPKMNTMVFTKLSSQVLFEEKAKEVEMSSRNYLEVIDGQHPDLLCSSPAIRDNQAVRHRRSGYVRLSVLLEAAAQHVWMRISWSGGETHGGNICEPFDPVGHSLAGRERGKLSSDLWEYLCGLCAK
ncbi:hypothetical protein ILYODFUR_027826 [Ilyodon furcidens]|uniref:Uncharacterized protein n=1 Tax=Ilyodon furcidens TaxID=33524 RepID=A0ABV0TFK2_9TELE